MGQKLKITLIDDLTGGIADRKFRFTVEGRTYTLDLSEESIAQFYRAVDPFITAAQRAKTVPVVTGITRPQVDPAQAEAIRSWARRQGYTIPSRGKIPQHVRDAFDITHAARDTAAG